MRRIAAAVVAVALLTSCAAGTQPSADSAAQRPWQSNLRILIGQLRSDLALTSIAGDTLAAAKAALTSDSHLYALLVAYDDFGVCREMVASATSAGQDARARPVATELVSACRHLERAAELFTRATTNNDPESLLDASIEARRASPSLVRARVALERTRTPGARE